MITQKKIFRYLQNYGLYHGLRLFFTVRKSASKGTITFRLPGCPRPISIRRGTSDFSVFEEVFIDRLYQGLPETNLRYLVDAGANIGLAALLLLQHYPEAQIICIEPEAENYKLLMSNLGGYPNVICLPNALWCSSTTLRFRDPTSESWAFEVVEGGGSGKFVEAVTLNSLIDRFDFPRIDLLKIDIEGSEKEVFETATEWVRYTGYIIVEVHDDMRPGAFRAVNDLMKKNNFSLLQEEPILHFGK